jgi:SAM-dependent methyltransferase
MELDQKSYYAHDKQYKTIANRLWLEKLYEENDKKNLFQKMGFENLFKKYQNKITVYIDVGCGGGYFLNRASPYFIEVIGIEPSKAAVDSATEINKNIKNISYINQPMMEGMRLVPHHIPYLITTSAVLSHITDEHVIKFLTYLNQTSPLGSALFFYEPFGKNIQTDLWHIRSKKWWIRNLQGWSVSFGSFQDSGYIKGIYGVKMDEQIKDDVYDTDHRFIVMINDFAWYMEGIFYKLQFSLKRLISKFIR